MEDSNLFAYQERSLLQIRPISSQEERIELDKEVKKDLGAYLLFPTHIVRKGKDIVGSFCLYSPTVYWWMHSKKTKVRDTLSVWQTVSALLANEGVLDFIIPCEPESPNFHFLSKKLTYLPSIVGNDFKLFFNKG